MTRIYTNCVTVLLVFCFVSANGTHFQRTIKRLNCSFSFYFFFCCNECFYFTCHFLYTTPSLKYFMLVSKGSCELLEEHKDKGQGAEQNRTKSSRCCEFYGFYGVKKGILIQILSVFNLRWWRMSREVSWRNVPWKILKMCTQVKVSKWLFSFSSTNKTFITTFTNILMTRYTFETWSLAFNSRIFTKQWEYSWNDTETKN